MKKLIALLLVLVMALSMAACGAENADPTTPDVEEPTAPAVEAPASALEVLEKVWALYADGEKFPVMGGNPEGGAMDAPANWDMAYAENLTYSLLIPAEQMANVDDAATMIHMMNANTFTSGVVHLAEGTDVAAFTTLMHDTIATNPWICGFPEKMLIADLGGNYVLIAFGVNDAMGPFQTHFAEAYADAAIVYDEAIA